MKISPFNLTTWEIEAGEVYLTDFEQQEFTEKDNETEKNQTEDVNKINTTRGGSKTQNYS
ncbi:MAG: hypothetical protein KatS3mg085_531 [Candidatus Dojkabacteria bacterium]|nr:MAG: hypothetical protein KatS3mg085_531 [Candidatus Dojkabacteria bacterium]